jgi:hypothetical protein
MINWNNIDYVSGIFTGMIISLIACALIYLMGLTYKKESSSLKKIKSKEKGK